MDGGAGDARAHPTGLGEVAVDVVAGEELVTTESREHHAHVLADEAVEQVQLQRVDLRLLGVADRIREIGQHGLGEHHFVMLGLVGLRHEAGVVELVGRFVEPEAERVDRARVALADHGHDRARVDAAGERHAERHVGEQLALDCGLVVAPDALHPVVATQRLVGGPVDARVRVVARVGAVELEYVTGGKRPDPTEQRALAGDVPHVHREVQAGLVELRVHEPAREHRLRLRAEREPVAALRVDHRLDAEGVAHHEQLAQPAVEEGEGEDPVQPGDEVDPLVLVEVGEDLGVTRGVELVAALEDEGAELRVVVGLAVVDDDDRAVLVAHGLRAALDVLDREPSVAEAHAVAHEEAVAVGASVHDRVRHRADQPCVAEPRGPRDPAHQPTRPVGHEASGNVFSNQSTIHCVTSILSCRRRSRASAPSERGESA